MLKTKSGTRICFGAAAGAAALAFASTAAADDPVFGWTRSFEGAHQIDLTGQLVYAVNMTPNADEEFMVAGQRFTSSESTRGVAVQSRFARDNWIARPEFGDAPGAAGLEEVMWDMRFCRDNVSIDANVREGRTYKLQLLFSDAFWQTAGNRSFDVVINGSQAINEFDILEVAGSHNGHVESGALYTFTFTARDSDLNIDLVAGTGPDPNPLINAFTLEIIPAPATVGLMGLGGLMMTRRRRRSVA